MERQILDSQERAFWNVHRPPVRVITVIPFIHMLLNIIIEN